MPNKVNSFQDVILTLQHFWAEQGCVILQPYDMEVGAGTFHPATFLRVLGPEPWKAAFVQPSRRPSDGRYGENPNRLGAYYQFQVGLKPAPLDVQDIYLESLRRLGLDPHDHDIRFVEDDWESPTLGASGLGWGVWAGGMDLKPITAELTYGLERITMYLQNCDNVYDLTWVEGVTYGQVHHQSEVEFSRFNFELSDPVLNLGLFDSFEAQCKRLLAAGAVLPAYDYCMKCSHSFNLLDARGAISVAERQRYIGRVRGLAKGCAEGYVRERARLGFPLLAQDKREAARLAFDKNLEAGVSAAAVAAAREVT